MQLLVVEDDSGIRQQAADKAVNVLFFASTIELECSLLMRNWIIDQEVNQEQDIINEKMPLKCSFNDSS